MKPIFLTGFGILTALIAAYYTQLLPAQLLLTSLFFVVLFTCLMLIMQRMSAQTKSDSSFVRNFMGTIIIKLFSALIFLTVVLYTHKSIWETKEKVAISLLVFATYILFTIVMGKSQTSK